MDHGPLLWGTVRGKAFLRQEKKTSLLPLPCEGGVDACLLTSIGNLGFHLHSGCYVSCGLRLRQGIRKKSCFRPKEAVGYT